MIVGFCIKYYCPGSNYYYAVAVYTEIYGLGDVVTPYYYMGSYDVAGDAYSAVSYSVGEDPP